MFRIMVVFWGLLCFPTAQAQQVPIGSWQEHFPWRFAVSVAATGNNMLCATRSGLFSVSLQSGAISRFHKINGLNGIGVRAADFDVSSGRMVLVYSDGGIEVVFNNQSVYIPDLKLANIAGSKQVRRVSCANGKGYLATDFGIVVIDLVKMETADTWYPGNGGNPLPVNEVLVTPVFVYAATATGVLRAPASGANLANFASWENIPGLPAAPFQSLAFFNNKLTASSGNFIYRENTGSFTVFHQSAQPVFKLKTINNTLAVVETNQVLVLNDDGSTAETFSHPSIPTPTDIAYAASTWWIADSANGLQRRSGNTWESFTPNGPNGIVEGKMLFHRDTLFAAGGTVTENGSGAGNYAGVFALALGSWINYTPGRGTIPVSLPDLNCIEKNTTNGYLYAGSLGGGLLEILPNGTSRVLKENIGLPPSQNNAADYRVRGLLFDSRQNLWIAADGAADPIAILKKDRSLVTLRPPFALAGQQISQMLEDNTGQIWMVSPGGNGLLSLHYNNTLENAADDRWRFFKAGNGNGNLPDNTVHCIAKDRNGFIWIGTNKGIGVMQCPTQAFSSSTCEVVLPIVQQDNFAGFLFQNEVVKSIAVDGANRKWIGTNNGVWLIGAEGEKVIARFTEENSPLPSNLITDIAINGGDGTVFIATSNGLCSFRGTATQATESEFSVKIFPNPVPPGYAGTIAIRELPQDAIVKITEPNGRLVFQTKALGGQAVWNGRDYKGNKVATGVYLVLVSDESRKENRVGKIIVTQ